MNWWMFILGLVIGAVSGVVAVSFCLANSRSEQLVERDLDDPLYRWARFAYLHLELAYDQKLFKTWTPIELILHNAPDEIALPSVTDRMYGRN